MEEKYISTILRIKEIFKEEKARDFWFDFQEIEFDLFREVRTSSLRRILFLFLPCKEGMSHAIWSFGMRCVLTLKESGWGPPSRCDKMAHQIV